ncbi:putative GNAT family acetyltransferase [Microbacteriaceae bacterium SG_E_30_P1]|uniref:GNAT family acetyltransferase n=1 Tax=Antiquaquibacter oligotrophicus TaxID=2880260 RepID=A0ABT6KQ81_9MICO|nr:GNAT family N-acetyltransferase [Antiquaquibacter oligotrophicus]MDH6182135.1 putative GNAT family acetyltransferase [Antiquaquibacter oligotrophicus]UDF12202.1 N-acetyltransferase [Antiquaquibacter oligotrophicus]
MSDNSRDFHSKDFEFPDAAGYPDGKGTLDEGTAHSADANELDEPSTDRDADIVVSRDDSGSLYRATLGDDEVAVMHVSGSPDSELVIESTVVDAAVRDRGIGTAFIAHVLDQVREAGGRIVPECSMVRSFLDENPEYADLRA